MVIGCDIGILLKNVDLKLQPTIQITTNYTYPKYNQLITLALQQLHLSKLQQITPIQNTTNSLHMHYNNFIQINPPLTNYDQLHLSKIQPITYIQITTKSLHLHYNQFIKINQIASKLQPIHDTTKFDFIYKCIVHDTSPNCTWGFLIGQLNVALALLSKMKVSLDEARTDARFAPYDVTLKSQSR